MEAIKFITDISVDDNECFFYSNLPNELAFLDLHRVKSVVINSPEFKALEYKTLLFPKYLFPDCKSNRLTHSLDVAQSFRKLFKVNFCEYVLELLEILGLIHDIGHPPFGHAGERILDYHMRQFGGFESNAQTIRFLNKNNLNFLSKALLKHKLIIPERRGGSYEFHKGLYSKDKIALDAFDDRNQTLSRIISLIDCVDELCYMISDTIDILSFFKGEHYLQQMESSIENSNALNEIIETIKANQNSSASDILETLYRLEKIQLDANSPYKDNIVAKINDFNCDYVASRGLFKAENDYLTNKIPLIFNYLKNSEKLKIKDDCTYRNVCDFLCQQSESYVLSIWREVENAVERKQYCSI